MRKRWLSFHGQRLVHLQLEGEPGRSLAEQGAGLFRRADSELKAHGLALADTVRTRIFGRTAEARLAGSDTRKEALTGTARAAGSSYITPAHFESRADVGLDLFAMIPSPPDARRVVTEHAPPKSYIRHLVWGPLVFLAGMSSERPTLKDQYEDILTRAGALLAETGCDWKDVAAISLFLHRSKDPEQLLRDVAAFVPVPLGNAEIEFVDGYSAPGKFLEIEITARKPG